MIKVEGKEAMGRSDEASFMSLQNDTLPEGGANDRVSAGKVSNSIHPINASKTDHSQGGPLHSTDAYYGIFNPQDAFMWPNYHHEFQQVQQSQWHIFQDCGYLYHVCRQTSYLPFNMQPLSVTDFHFQEFQYFVVIDFEATCDKERTISPQEIIEFPAVLVNSMTGQIDGYFQIYVRPVYHKKLTDFCKELTGIQQSQVDVGAPLCDALLLHDKWLEDAGIKHTNFAVVTWGDWDCRNMLEQECKLKKIRKPPYFNKWINLKVPFREAFGEVHCNLKQAVQLAGLTWEGRPHCGLDDAKNTAKLLLCLMSRGFKLSITNAIPKLLQPSDQLVVPCQLPPYVVPPAQVNIIGPLASSPPGHTCHCGVRSVKSMIRKPGPKQGCFFYGCGNWSTARGAVCSYFVWTS